MAALVLHALCVSSDEDIVANRVRARPPRGIMVKPSRVLPTDANVLDEHHAHEVTGHACEDPEEEPVNGEEIPDTLTATAHNPLINMVAEPGGTFSPSFGGPPGCRGEDYNDHGDIDAQRTHRDDLIRKPGQGLWVDPEANLSTQHLAGRLEQDSLVRTLS